MLVACDMKEIVRSEIMRNRRKRNIERINHQTCLSDVVEIMFCRFT